MLMSGMKYYVYVSEDRLVYVYVKNNVFMVL